MAAKTLRNLVAGSGTVDVTSGSAKLVFSAAQQFKHGATIKLSGGQLFTIVDGMGTSWTARQKATSTVSGSSYDTSDPSATARGRGTSGFIVPWAVHSIYCSLVDDAGSFDYYTYVDTLLPDGGSHPYTKDPVVGAFYATQALNGGNGVMLTLDRVRLLEGILRGTSGNTVVPDQRLTAIESKLAPAILSGHAVPINSATSYYPATCDRDAGLASDNAGSRAIMHAAGNIKNMYVQSDVAPGAGKSWVITVRKNGTDQSMSVTLSGASQTTGSWTGAMFQVAVGDSVSVKVVPSGTPAAAKISWGMDFVALDANNGGSLETLLSRGDA